MTGTWRTTEIPLLPERFRHQRLISALQQARTEILVQLVATIDHGARKALQLIVAQHLRVFV